MEDNRLVAGSRVEAAASQHVVHDIGRIEVDNRAHSKYTILDGKFLDWFFASFSIPYSPPVRQAPARAVTRRNQILKQSRNSLHGSRQKFTPSQTKS
jgi:hypothetical protein